MGQKLPLASQPQSVSPKEQSLDHDFFQQFPRCIVTHRPVQLDNDCYAHATAYAYSLRNCASQHSQVNKYSDILIRSPEDALRATWPNGTPCGTPEDGGDSACVAAFFWPC